MTSLEFTAYEGVEYYIVADSTGVVGSFTVDVSCR